MMRGAVAYSGQGIGLATWTGRRFDSRQLHFHVVPQPWASRSHTHVSQLPSSVVCYQPKGGGSIDVKKRFYVFIQGTFLTFFILPTFFIFKNVHWKCHLKSLSKERKQIGSVWLFFLGRLGSGTVHMWFSSLSSYRPFTTPPPALW